MEREQPKVEKTAAGIELVFATEFTDGGTYCATLRYPSGKELDFCVSTEDGYPGKWLPNRLYVDVHHPTQAGARLVPIGSDEEMKVIRDLEAALAPYQTEEGKRDREKLPKFDFLGRYWQLICAEGLLNRLYDVASRKPKEGDKPKSAQPQE